MKLLPGAGNHVSHGGTCFQALGASLNQNRSWFWHFGILKMSFPNLRKVWGIVYCWPRYFGFNQQPIWCWPKCQNQMWSWLRRTYPSQWYTILQTFPPFGNDIFKIPKCQNQLRFWFKLAPSAWKHVLPCDTWFHAPGKSFMPYGRFPEGLSVPGYTKTPGKLRKCFKLAPSAWNSVPPCDTWF